ncbi:MAG: cob(I)yrinic acid a,c-diamide adenosyltransferase [Chloroflexi bacterium]|nr:cob(I)yrinic acid a,c-diamide adenosyltransferase [Chloroflexota bacterium]
MKIYTKTGDSGETSLFGGGRVPKTHPRVEACGAVDELNSMLGLARALRPSDRGDAWLADVQNQLFHLGADLATPLDTKADWITRIAAGDIEWLETTIDEMTAELAPLRNFILPGGTAAAAAIQAARAVSRRAERRLVALDATEDIGAFALPYVNRLSDWLFTLARYENMRAGEKESKWTLR